MSTFSNSQVNAVRDLFNKYLTSPLSVDGLQAVLSDMETAPAIRSRKKRYVIAIINAMASTLEDPATAAAFRHDAAAGFGISADSLRTESAKIVKHSRRNDAVKESIYGLMDEVLARLDCSDNND